MMDASAHVIDRLRVAPAIQQGGTQTIQQSIYLTHDNPCGINRLIFQEMGYTSIRYIDLKNYLDAILGSAQMKLLFEQVRIDATDFMKNPLDEQKQNKYLYSLGKWAQAGIENLPIPIDTYQGYKFSFSVFDGSGCLIYDSNTPTLEIIEENLGIYTRTTVPLTQIYYPIIDIYVPDTTSTDLYKLCNDYILLPFVNDPVVASSNFIINQLSLPETIMSVSSLLVDSANTRTFGVPKYGFSNRSNQLQVEGIAYYCAQIISINSTPEEDGDTTLVENIFARLALEEDGTPPTSVQKQSMVLRPPASCSSSLQSPKYKLLSLMKSMKKN